MRKLKSRIIQYRKLSLLKNMLELQVLNHKVEFRLWKKQKMN